MVDFTLGVTTCDKCGEPMKKGEKIITVAEGNISKSNDVLDCEASDIRYACHHKCWDGFEESD